MQHPSDMAFLKSNILFLGRAPFFTIEDQSLLLDLDHGSVGGFKPVGIGIGSIGIGT